MLRLARLGRRESDELGEWQRRPGRRRRARNDDATTHVDIKMTYAPPAAAIGHAASTLLRVDPKKQMDDDLARAKTYLETGKPAHDAAQGAAAR